MLLISKLLSDLRHTLCISNYTNKKGDFRCSSPSDLINNRRIDST